MTRFFIKEKENFETLAIILKSFMSIQKAFKNSQSQTHSSLHHQKYFQASYHPHNHTNLHLYYHQSYHQKQHSLEKGLGSLEKTQKEKKLLSQALSLQINPSKFPNLLNLNYLQKRLRHQMLNLIQNHYLKL